MSKSGISIYLSYLLRHNPDELSLSMDRHGWVPVDELIDRINERGKYYLSVDLLQTIVSTDNKGRYRFIPEKTKIKACQGHSISWVEPELVFTPPPPILYHGTTWSAYQAISQRGSINKMSRHAVHLTAVEGRAWQSARRRKTRAVVLKIDASSMNSQGYTFGVSENEVWCTDAVPIEFISDILCEDGYGGSKSLK